MFFGFFPYAHWQQHVSRGFSVLAAHILAHLFQQAERLEMTAEFFRIRPAHPQPRFQKTWKTILKLESNTWLFHLTLVPKREASCSHLLCRRSDNIIPARPISEKLDCPIKAFELLGLLHLVLRKQTVRPV